MTLKELNIINFKNIASSNFSFSNKINCFVGDNGVGKTNILDAIHYLSLCKSGWGLSDRMCIRHEEEFFLIEGEYALPESRKERVTVSYKKSKIKSIKRNGKEYSKLAEHIGLLPFVMISPYDYAIINESGEERRRFLNSFISQIDRSYLYNMIRYNAIIMQRNKILKATFTTDNSDVLEIIDMQLSELSEMIFKRRDSIISELAPLVANFYKRLSDDRECVELKYTSALHKTPIEELLSSSRERDRVLGYTSMGVHRDDIKMSIMEYPIRKYGSQGQQKSFLVALKLAQYELLYRHHGIKPLLILDDIFDKLDMQRVSRLIEITSEESFGQIFISDCNPQRLNTILSKTATPHKIFEITL